MANNTYILQNSNSKMYGGSEPTAEAAYKGDRLDPVKKTKKRHTAKKADRMPVKPISYYSIPDGHGPYKLDGHGPYKLSRTFIKIPFTFLFE